MPPTSAPRQSRRWRCEISRDVPPQEQGCATGSRSRVSHYTSVRREHRPETLIDERHWKIRLSFFPTPAKKPCTTRLNCSFTGPWWIGQRRVAIASPSFKYSV